jgi:hypothetical protein
MEIFHAILSLDFVGIQHALLKEPLLMLWYIIPGFLTWYWVYFMHCTARRSMYPIDGVRPLIPFRCFLHDIRCNTSESYRTKYMQKFAEGKRGTCMGATDVWHFLHIRGNDPEEARRAGNDVLGGFYWMWFVLIGFFWPILLPLFLIGSALRKGHKRLQLSWAEDEIKWGDDRDEKPSSDPLLFKIITRRGRFF